MKLGPELGYHHPNLVLSIVHAVLILPYCRLPYQSPQMLSTSGFSAINEQPVIDIRLQRGYRDDLIESLISFRELSSVMAV